MSAPLTDAAARRRIRTDTATSLFVEAGAGSGKTRALVERIRTLVLDDGVPLASIAAVTFTEKAGAELRARLRSAFEAVERAERAVRRGGADGGAVDIDGGAPSLRERRATAGLEDLDAAAIGTLHAFAQRILTRHAIAAGLPPELEVADEVSSGLAFEQRWSDTRRELLDDPAMSPHLLMAMSAGVTLEHLRALARAFGNDWDLADERVPPPEDVAVALPEVDLLAARARELAGRAIECTDPSDRFLERLAAIGEWGRGLGVAADARERYAALGAAVALKTSYGRAKSWPDLAGLREDCSSLIADAKAAADAVTDATLRPLAAWIARRVVADARARATDGRLEFHDLLVLARELLRRDASVRAALQRDFGALLLDEFQDTDPIQVELAVRIAAGADGGAADWHDIATPPGSLFVVGDPKQSIYRFRRADIRVFLDVADWFGPEARTGLATNFRTTRPILDWVNAVFGRLIAAQDAAQPAYQALAPHREAVGVGPPVAALGARAHEDLPRAGASVLREREAADVAAVLARAKAEGWTVVDDKNRDENGAPVERAMSWHDVAVLVPARTSLPYLEDALEAAGIPFRAESSSLVYSAPEVRALMAAARAVADPADTFAVVTALRSQLYGCGDDDLWTWRRDGGSFSLLAPVHEDTARAGHPVARALTHLRDVRRDVRWSTPSEVLARLVADRRMLEVPATSQRRAREQWRRLRYVVDQARAWSEVAHGGLSAYLEWAARQADESSRVAEAILPETDVDAVRIMTVHAAKGLEFPVVVLSGLTSQPISPRGVRVLWTDIGYEVRLKADVQTEEFEAAQPVDEQMDSLERRRLLYVAATRARDHLVVSLHRKAGTGGQRTNAELLAVEGEGVRGATVFEAGTHPVTVDLPRDPVAPPPWAEWSARVEAAQARSRRVPVISPSGLEGTDPAVALGGSGARWDVIDLAEAFVGGGDLAEAADGAPSDLDPADGAPPVGGSRADGPPSEFDPADGPATEGGWAKGARDVELPPWSKGRDGTAVGRAVHGVLQSLDLATSEGVDGAVAAQCVAEGVVEHADVVAALVRSALASPLVRWAAEREHWPETFVGAPLDDDRVLEGFIDLLVRDTDGRVTVVDYKTDAVPVGALGLRTAYYAPQLRAYADALRAAGVDVVRAVLLFLNPAGAVERDVSLG
ncbi:DNA helicase UvrD [Miniimonas arenae]|uniref:DNA 3'-5' helicase n=1 Tax=Miniimonas arenae TaxID=676201 RepID=A0A5C5BDI5_9MICO|nr:UvrD-helicase domain-containing protein [Miniimonas arenae]TNU76518.1 DNA helicase UvrD [Miniimonas arenae]